MATLTKSVWPLRHREVPDPWQHSRGGLYIPTGGNNRFAIWAESSKFNRCRMPFELSFLMGRDRPYVCDLIFAGGDNHFTIRAEGHRFDGAGMQKRITNLLTGSAHPHRRAVLSQLAVAIILPSGLKVTFRIFAVWLCCGSVMRQGEAFASAWRRAVSAMEVTKGWVMIRVSVIQVFPTASRASNSGVPLARSTGWVAKRD